jgi:hypothetical protein
MLCMLCKLSAASMLQVVPSTAMAFTIYDYMKAHLDLPTNL